MEGPLTSSGVGPRAGIPDSPPGYDRFVEARGRFLAAVTHDAEPLRLAARQVVVDLVEGRARRPGKAHLLRQGEAARSPGPTRAKAPSSRRLGRTDTDPGSHLQSQG